MEEQQISDQYLQKIKVQDVILIECDIHNPGLLSVFGNQDVRETSKIVFEFFSSYNGQVDKKNTVFPIVLTQLIDKRLEQNKQYMNTINDKKEREQSWKLIDAQTKLKDQVTEVRRYTISFQQQLVKILDDYQSRNSIVLYGIQAHLTIQQTCLLLLSQGQKVYILVDAVSSQRQIDRDAAFWRMEQAGAIMTTAESLIGELVSENFLKSNLSELFDQRSGPQLLYF